jgi:hypothetical protein
LTVSLEPFSSLGNIGSTRSLHSPCVDSLLRPIPPPSLHLPPHDLSSRHRFFCRFGCPPLISQHLMTASPLPVSGLWRLATASELFCTALAISRPHRRLSLRSHDISAPGRCFSPPLWDLAPPHSTVHHIGVLGAWRGSRVSTGDRAVFMTRFF